MDALILRIFLILRKFPMMHQNSKKNSKNKTILRIRILVNTGPALDPFWVNMCGHFHENRYMGMVCGTHQNFMPTRIKNVRETITVMGLDPNPQKLLLR